MSLIRSITTVGSYTIGSRVFGFVREILTASFLGAGAAADGLVFAIKFPSFFRRLFAEGALNASFIPLFAGLLATKGENEARSFAEQILTIWVGALFVLIVLIELFLPIILPVIVPGFSATPERLFYAIEFSRITFPFIFFISLTALYSGILNSFDKFAIVACSPLVGNMVIIAVVLSVQDLVFSPGSAFAWGVMLSGIGQLLCVWIPAFRRGMGLRLVWPQLSGNVVAFFKILAPAAFGSGVVQVNLFIGAFMASWLPVGCMSYLSYADRLNQLPLSVIGIAVSTVLLPILSRHIRGEAWEEARKVQSQAIEFSMFLTLPATIALVFLADPLIQLVFERGAFTTADSHATAWTLQALAVGLPAYVLIKIFSSNFFARQDTRTPLYTACVGIGVDIALSLALMDTYHQVGIAFATAIAAWSNAFCLGYILWRKGHLVFENRLVHFLNRMAITCGSTVILLKALQFCLQPLFLEGDWARAGMAISLLSAGICGFLILSHLLGALRFGELKLMFAKA